MKVKSAAMLFSIMIVIGVGLYYTVQFGFYPVAFIDGDAISMRRFQQTAASAEHYYEQEKKGYSNSDTDDEISLHEIQRSILDKLVEDSLIANELKKTERDAENIVENKLRAFSIQEAEVADAVQTLYGLNTKQFREIILKPRAQLEALSETNIISAEEYDSWLLSKKKDATVFILDSRFMWSGDAVVFRS